MAMRLSGLMSGMDTETIISELVAVKRTKVDEAVKAQKKLQWKQESWKNLNSQITKLYNGALSNLRFSTAYMKKTTKVSNPDALTVITGENAVNSVQSLKINKLSKSAYLTGADITEIKDASGKVTGHTADYKVDSVLTASKDDGGLGLAVGSEIAVAKGDGTSTNIKITEGMTINELVTKLKDAGVNASFDETNQRFFISAKTTGKDGDFTLTGVNESGLDALDALGISSYGANEKAYYQNVIDSADATKEQRIEAKRKALLDKRSSLEDAQAESLKKLDELATKFETEFADVDLTDMDAVKTKIEELVATEGGEEKYADLKSWAETYDKTATELADVNGKLIPRTTTDEGGNPQEVVDEDGNPVYELSAESVAEIEAAVDAEVAAAQDILTKLDARTGTAANKISGENAEIELNGVIFTSNSNTFEINGLTMTMNATTAPNEEITVTTQDDTDGIYDMIKDFFKEYNALINQMDKLYNADSAEEYDPLTDEEKADMSETAIEEWETKIKDGLLRRDSTLSTVASAMKQVMMSGFEVNGQKMYLSSFGIETLSYFISAENEKSAYHINGDPDDAATSGNADKLKGMIASDPDTVVSFFTQLSRELYSKLGDLMKGTDYSSSYTVYDDKKMQSDYDDYTKKIAELEDKLNDYEDSWYAKFAKMETAMAKMQSNASAVTSLIGG